MKTIDEINKISPYGYNEWQQGYGIWQAGYLEGQKDSAEEQKKIDIAMFEKWYCNNKCYRRKYCQIPLNICARIGEIEKQMEKAK
ncbi:MAG: hypothetical protein ACI4N3_01140 [Alphaproteobacteria bacterium]